MLLDYWPIFYILAIYPLMYLYAKVIDRRIRRGGPGW
jgi:hypothetical protein